MAPACFPEERASPARVHLHDVGERVRPVTLARDRALALGGGLADLVPGGSMARGTVVRVTGASGDGSTTVAFSLAAAVTALGEWAAAVDLDGTLGALAAEEAGVALERFAVARRVPPSRWATVVAALLEGTSLVLAEVPVALGAVDARRLVARARERETVLVLHERDPARWPAESALVLHAGAGAWEWSGGAGFLADRRIRVRVEGRGAASRPRAGELARAV